MKRKTIILLVSGLLLCGSALWPHDYGITEKEAVRQNLAFSQPAAKQRENGVFVYKSNRAQGIRIGRGGSKIEMETLNGDIIISNDENKL